MSIKPNDFDNFDYCGIAEFSTKLFTIDKKNKTFISELSELKGNTFKQIFSDACDEGLTLVSEISGNKSDWFINDFEYTNNIDKELVAIHLLPTPETIRKFPGLKDYKMVLLND